MQQTTKYQFNLIDTSDAFSPDAINANAEAAERELLAVRAELAAGNSAVRAEFAAADKTLSQTIAAVEKGAFFYKLGEAAAEAENQAVTFDLSGLDMSQYAALLLITGGTGNTVSARLSVNGVSLGTIAEVSGYGNGYSSHAAFVGALIPAGKWVVVTGFYGGTSYNTYYSRVDQRFSAIGNAAELDWASITWLETTGVYPAGTGFTLYGIKK